MELTREERDHLIRVLIEQLAADVDYLQGESKPGDLPDANVFEEAYLTTAVLKKVYDHGEPV